MLAYQTIDVHAGLIEKLVWLKKPAEINSGGDRKRV